MRVFLSGLLILAHLLCLSLPATAAAYDSSSAGIDVNNKVGEGSSGTIKPDSYTSFLSPAYIITGIQNAYLPSALRLTSAIQAFIAPESSPPDFWETVMKYEKTLQDYIPRLLDDAAAYFESTKFTDITSTMHNIVSITSTFREGIQGTLETNHITLDALTEELELVFMGVVHDLENIPSPDNAPSHAERTEMVDEVLANATLVFTSFAHRHGIEEEVITTYLDALKPQVRALIVAVGDINEQHPTLFPILAFSIAALLIPESWILRPFLSLFGFGPSGPVKGSAAAWLQRYFWGSAVEAGSWFSMLQAAGMGILPKWAWLVTSLPLLLASMLAFFFPCFGRRSG